MMEAVIFCTVGQWCWMSFE